MLSRILLARTLAGALLRARDEGQLGGEDDFLSL